MEIILRPLIDEKIYFYFLIFDLGQGVKDNMIMYVLCVVSFYQKINLMGKFIIMIFKNQIFKSKKMTFKKDYLRNFETTVIP